MFIYTTGNMFLSEAQTLVNPVNCVGVMGKGLALEFKKQYPDMFYAYVDACQHGKVTPGSVWIYHTKGKSIVCFPTKNHWRDKSLLHDIEYGLKDLRQVIERYKITSIAIPPLGCGLGGLKWKDVKPLIRDILSFCSCKIYLYEPTK